MQNARVFGTALLGLVACTDPAKTDATPAAKPSAPMVVPSGGEVGSGGGLPSTKDAGAPVAASTKPDFKCDNAPTATFHMPGLEADVRKKLAKKGGRAHSAMKELAGIKSINVSTSHVDYLDPCIFPKLTGMKDLLPRRGRPRRPLAPVDSHGELVWPCVRRSTR